MEILKVEPLNKAHEDRYPDPKSHRLNDFLNNCNHKIGIELVSDRLRTQFLLKKVGLPVPQNQAVYFQGDLKAAIEKVGSYPVKIEPLDAANKQGITLNINNFKKAKAACQLALQESKSGGILVEKYYCGCKYRILVVNGRILRVIEIMPAYVVKEKQSIQEKSLATSDRLPSNGSEKNQQTCSHTSNSLSEANKPINLNVADANQDKIICNFTNKIHLQNVYLAQIVATIVGLDAVEIEIVCDDLSLPLSLSNGVIIDVNSSFKLNSYFL